MNVTDAIRILSRREGSQYRFEREFAVATLSGWLNSPDDNGEQISVVFTAINRAILYAKEKKLIIPSEWFADVYDAKAYLNTDEVVLSHPKFWFLDDHLYYNDCRYSGDIVRFLLTFRPKATEKTKQASLGKAWDFINKHGGYVRGNFDFGRTSWCSLSAHHNKWRVYKNSAVFQCARYYGSKFDWYIDPRDENFLDRLVETAGLVEAIRGFLGEALYLQQRLKCILDERSMRDGDYFQFPASLEPKKCSLPPMTASAYAKMATYRNSSALKLQDLD